MTSILYDHDFRSGLEAGLSIGILLGASAVAFLGWCFARANRRDSSK